MPILRMFAVLTLVTVVLEAQVTSPGGAPIHRVEVTAADPEAAAAALSAADYTILGASEERSVVEVLCSSAELAALASSGLAPFVVETAQPLAAKLAIGRNVPSGYHDLPSIEAAMTAFAAAHPTIAQVVDVSTTFGPGPTFEGRTIKVMKISDNVALDEDEPNVLVVAMHHPYEIVTPEVVLDHIGRLVSGYGVDPSITALIDGHEIWMAPVWNPDGLVQVWNTNNFWRGNMAPQAGGNIGVDLNRNYDLGWNAPCAGSSNPGSSNYKGTVPFSEIESQTMRAFARDRRFAKVMDFHSHGREVLLSYACTPMPSLIEAFHDAEGIALANTIGYATRDPSADGEDQQWHIKELTTYAFLTETQTTFQPPHQAALSEAALLWPLMLSFFSRDIPVTGHVTDMTSGAPLAASIEIVGVNWSAGETRQAEGRFGRYHLFLPAGQHQVRFSHPGFMSTTRNVQVGAAGTVVVDVALVPLVGDIGQPNTPTASLIFSGAIDVNGLVPGAQNGPYFATYTDGEVMHLHFEAAPIKQFILLLGPLNRNNAVGPLVGSLDIGMLGNTNDFSDLVVLMNGTAPAGFLDLLAITDATGVRDLAFSIPPLPPTTLGAMQAWIHQSAGPPVLSAATEIRIQ